MRGLDVRLSSAGHGASNAAKQRPGRPVCCHRVHPRSAAVPSLRRRFRPCRRSGPAAERHRTSPRQAPRDNVQAARCAPMRYVATMFCVQPATAIHARQGRVKLRTARERTTTPSATKRRSAISSSAPTGRSAPCRAQAAVWRQGRCRRRRAPPRLNAAKKNVSVITANGSGAKINAMTQRSA